MPGKLTFALPSHPGLLSLEQRDWKITEFSAKTNGTEFGIRALDRGNQLLGFLYPDFKGKASAESCRESMLKTERIDQSSDVTERALVKSDSGVEIATVLIKDKQANRLSDFTAGTAPATPKTVMIFRAFAGSGQLCVDIGFSFDFDTSEDQKTKIESFQSELRTLQFDPKAKPTFMGAFTYATVELTHFANTELHNSPARGAFEGYQIALDRVGSSGDPAKWGPITTDQRAIAFSMIQGMKSFQSTLESVVAHKPEYPGPYLLLAKSEAADKNPEAARLHLQQAFDRRANILPGELFPSLIKDPDLLRLKDNREFWSFVEDLSQQLNTTHR